MASARTGSGVNATEFSSEPYFTTAAPANAPTARVARKAPVDDDEEEDDEGGSSGGSGSDDARVRIPVLSGRSRVLNAMRFGIRV